MYASSKLRVGTPGRRSAINSNRRVPRAGGLNAAANSRPTAPSGFLIRSATTRSRGTRCPLDRVAPSGRTESEGDKISLRGRTSGPRTPSRTIGANASRTWWRISWSRSGVSLASRMSSHKLGESFHWSRTAAGSASRVGECATSSINSSRRLARSVIGSGLFTIAGGTWSAFACRSEPVRIMFRRWN